MFVFSHETGTSTFVLRLSISGATLLEIKKSFRNVDNILYDWSESSSDYCSWRGVICDKVTFDVAAL
jgi:LRR receptor-like serine/threonine-protein kinase ERECTA